MHIWFQEQYKNKINTYKRIKRNVEIVWLYLCKWGKEQNKYQNHNNLKEEK